MTEIKSRSELWKLLRPRATIAEVGVAEGRYSREMLNWPNYSVVSMIDKWGYIAGQKGDGGHQQAWHDKNYSSVLKIKEDFAERCGIFRGMSSDVARGFPDRFFDMVYIDCDHSYNGVVKDLAAWWPKIEHGGILAGHDILNPKYGIEEAVQEFALLKKLKVIIIPESEPENASFYIIKPSC